MKSVLKKIGLSKKKNHTFYRRNNLNTLYYILRQIRFIEFPVVLII